MSSHCVFPNLGQLVFLFRARARTREWQDHSVLEYEQEQEQEQEQEYEGFDITVLRKDDAGCWGLRGS